MFVSLWVSLSQLCLYKLLLPAIGEAFNIAHRSSTTRLSVMPMQHAQNRNRAYTSDGTIVNRIRQTQLFSLADYVMHRKAGLGPNASSRWGRRMDRERKHNYGNVPGNEEIGGCNPEYKFAETFFEDDEEVHQWPPEKMLVHSGKLYWHLRGKDGAPYGSYKSLLGQWNLRDSSVTVTFDRIQSDPFAPPSNIRVRVPKAEHRFPDDVNNSAIRNMAACDAITRKIFSEIENLEEEGSNASPRKLGFEIIKPKQYVIQRKTVILNDDYLEVRLLVHMPANGRRINGKLAVSMFNDILPIIVENAMTFDKYDQKAFYKHIHSVEDQEYLRAKLAELGLIAFVANGAVLPRESGASDEPLSGDSVQPFKAPSTMEVTVTLPNRGTVEGMGIKQGVTLIVGGGYHGKTTLLEALQVGCYNKIPGDGREYVVTSTNAVKIRAEDGRSVNGVDISSFIGALPNGKTGKCFSSQNASGSTSQAAIIMESIEMGADVLLLDEDISASNLMYRDGLMDTLVSKESEPITTFLLLVKQFYEKLNVSTILVSGSCGLYMDQADTIIQMNEYRCLDKTDDAKKIIADNGINLNEEIERAVSQNELFQDGLVNSRVVSPQTFKRVQQKIRQRGKAAIQYGTENIDLSYVEQIVEPMQTCTITNIIIYLESLFHENRQELHNKTLRELLENIYSKWTSSDNAVGYNGLDEVNGFKPFPAGDCSMPRIFEVAAAINRMSNLKISHFSKSPYERQRYTTNS